MRRRKPRFAVVTSVVTILAILGALIQALHPFLPTPAPTNDFSDSGGFLQQSSQETIHWLPLSDSDFLEARQSQKPLLLFVGSEWNRDARIADRETFSDADVQALMGSDYISVRIDCDESPEWLNAFYPVSRYGLGMDRGCQSYFTDPSGTMYDYLTADAIAHHRDNADLTTAMLAGRLEMRNSEKAPVDQSQAAIQQTRDINTLMAPHPAVWPNFADFEALLRSKIDPKLGGLPENDAQVPLADVYRYALASHKIDILAASLDPLLRSPMVDWVDGGFFAQAGVDWTDVHFDKIAVCNAALMSAVASYAALYRDPFAKTIATRTFDALSTDFVRDQGLLASCGIGDELPNNRSKRASLNEQDVRSFWSSSVFPDADRKWAVKYLNLDLNKNPQLIPWVSDSEVITKQAARLDRTLSEMRAAKSDVRRRYSQIAYSDVNGFAISRMIECARMWNDPQKMLKAQSFKERLERLRVGTDLDHRFNQKHGGPELTDYLAYADVSLQDYLATGNVHSFNLGMQVLLEAKSLFELRTPGAWLMARSSPKGLPRNYLAPEVADDLYESCTAREIRLMGDYSRLLEGNQDEGAISAELGHDAKAAITQFAPAAQALGVHAAGYYCSALNDSARYAIAVGPKAVDLANDLYRLDPVLFVAPAVGPVRPDLQARPRGIYLIKGKAISGPFTDARAALKAM